MTLNRRVQSPSLSGVTNFQIVVKRLVQKLNRSFLFFGILCNIMPGLPLKMTLDLLTSEFYQL